MLKFLQVLLGFSAFAHVLSPIAALDFTGAQWIWTATGRNHGDAYDAGRATFRRDYLIPAGKIPLSASFVIAADDQYQLFYDGNIIGSGTSYFAAQRYCVAMASDQSNPTAFIVVGTNMGGPAGLLAAVQIQYLDGSNDTIVTDGTWRAIEDADSDYEDASFNDGGWSPAYVQGPFPTTAPWYGRVSLPAELSLPLVPVTTPSLRSASWVWTNDYASGAIGARPFRKTVTFGNNQFVDSLVMDIVADDAYTLYVNGMLVGSGTSYTGAQRWHVRFTPASTVVIAVYAFNAGGPAGLIASGVIQSCACGCGYATTFQTDESWTCRNDVRPAFIDLEYNDSDWDNAVIEGPYGMEPWGNIPEPTAASPQIAALPGAPYAPPATVIV